MKSLTDLEIDALLETLKPYQGARLQKILFSGTHQLAIELFLKETVYWIIDLNPKCPVFFLSPKVLFKPSKKNLPLQLFLRAHFSGRHLAVLRRDEDLGRVVHVSFSEGGEWWLHLYPHGQNFAAMDGDKSIHYRKPQIKLARPAGRTEAEPRAVRSPAEILDQWRTENTSRPAVASSSKTPFIEKWISKRKKLITHLKRELDELQLGVWNKAGEQIKSFQENEVPRELAALLAKLPTVSEKIEFCFAKEKKLLQKKSLLEERIKTLHQELKNPPVQEAAALPPQMLKKIDETIKYKTFHRGPWTLWVGRSGKDNLSLLRSAKPWYLWLHVKDEPGAHGIVRREKGKDIPPKDLLALGEQFLNLSLAESALRRLGGSSVEVLVTECRFVRPIKGDKHGQVTYSKGQVIRVNLVP